MFCHHLRRCTTDPRAECTPVVVTILHTQSPFATRGYGLSVSGPQWRDNTLVAADMHCNLPTERAGQGLWWSILLENKLFTLLLAGACIILSPLKPNLHLLDQTSTLHTMLLSFVTACFLILLAAASGPTKLYIDSVPEYDLLPSCAEHQVSLVVRSMAVSSAPFECSRKYKIHSVDCVLIAY